MENIQPDSTQAELELSVIKKIMEDSRSVVLDNGWHYIFWGITVSAALIANYIMVLSRVSGNYQGLMWFVLMILAYAIVVIIERRTEKKIKVKTFAGRIINALWAATGVAMFIFGFIGVITKSYDPIFISPIISTALGISYYTSGVIQQVKWLQYLSVGWWAGALVLFYQPSVHTLIIFAGMVICFQIIPGIILHRQYRNESNKSA
ncbi:MAG: hypothetical protein IT281_05860 [Ignavibacteria bacterium]|nr:hypothetical protein [Ignavibacteria bacterium]MCC7159043.1 hypothetical protein [Ignavibacteria bacterium]